MEELSCHTEELKEELFLHIITFFAQNMPLEQQIHKASSSSQKPRKSHLTWCFAVLLHKVFGAFLAVGGEWFLQPLCWPE